MNRFLTTVAKQCQPKLQCPEVIKEKERGHNNHYFTQEDQRLMCKLLKQMKASNDLIKKGITNEANYREQLQNILSRYSVIYTEALVEQILKWKRND